MVPSILLAIVGAFLFAVSAALQQYAASAVPPEEDERPAVLRIFGLLRRLTRDPLWLLGWVANVGGFAAQAVALHLGSIVVVQALVVTQLLFALPLGTVPFGRRPLPRDWVGTAAVCAGLVSLLATRGDVPQTSAPRSHVWSLVAIDAGLIGLLVLVSWFVRAVGHHRTAAIATGAGICISVTAVLVVTVGNDISGHGLSGALGLPLAALCGSTLLSMVLVQEAFAAGTLATALTAMTIADPLASWIAGTVLFDAKPAVSPAALAGSVLALVLIGIGVAVLASSPTLRAARHPSPRTPVEDQLPSHSTDIVQRLP
jgi:hypothetical protein